MNYKLSISLMITVVLAVVSVVAPVYAETETFEKTYQVEPGTKLELRNKNGDVTIRLWDQPQVKVFAEKKSRRGGNVDDVEISVSTGDTMVVETVYHVKNPKVSITYDIQIPAEVIVSFVHTSNGSITVEGVQGDTNLKTSNGVIEVKDVKGNLHATTSNGSIEIKDVQGIVGAETNNGNIEIAKVAGIRGAETSNGSIDAEIPAINDDTIIKTSNGSIKLYLPADLNATFDIKTSNGKITLHDDLEMTVSGEISRTKLQGKLGNGGPKISVKTSNGRINLYKLP